MKIEGAQHSDVGSRARNEDSVLLQFLADNQALLAVADGLGGHFDGQEASRIATECIKAAGSDGDLATALLAAHHQIVAGQAQGHSGGMATTATAVRISGYGLTGAHCGDSRCVIQRGKGIKKLTIEQTEAERLFQNGKISKRELLSYPRRNILESALGAASPPKIDTFSFEIQRGDKIIITSDGVHELIKTKEMLGLVQDCSNVADIVSVLVRRVNQIGATDNFSVVAALIG